MHTQTKKGETPTPGLAPGSILADTEQLTDVGLHAAGNLQGLGDSAASLSPAHVPRHLFFQALPLPKDSVTSFCCGAESPGLRGTHEEQEGTLMSWTTLNLPLRPSAWLEKGCFLEGRPHRPHCTDTSRLLPAYHHTDVCYTCATDHPMDHVLQSTIQHGAGVPGTSEGDGRREKLCPASLSPILQSYNPNLTRALCAASPSPASVSSGCVHPATHSLGVHPPW